MTDLERLVEAAQGGDLECVKSLLDQDHQLARERDESGATALHYAALNGHRQIVELLVERGANVNSRDGQFGATPAGWAIEYLRELGGHLAIELDDLAFAIRAGDARWVTRFLTRFPALRKGFDTNGTPFQQLARECGNPEIAKVFEEDAA
jgi:ankyrin repeat protein